MTQQQTEEYIPPDENTEEIDRPIPRQPWSAIGQEFAEVWGRLDPSNPEPEHLEIVGPTRSGKTLLMCKIVQERMLVRHTPIIIMQSKPADGTVMKLGWPVITNGDVRKVQRERWAIYWPQTNATGTTRKRYQADMFAKLLDTLWRPDANTVLVWDDVGYIESLYTTDGQSIGDIMEMYLREGGSSGITSVLVKQRPQGSRRVMHSETQWTIGFPPIDEDDRERFAQLFGNKKRYVEVLKDIDPAKHEFLMKHFATQSETISWIDTPLRPIKRPERNVNSRP